MNKSDYSQNDGPDTELNKIRKQPFWQHPQFNLILYLIFIFLSFHF